jgi:hypothetical protein
MDNARHYITYLKPKNGGNTRTYSMRFLCRSSGWIHHYKGNDKSEAFHYTKEEAERHANVWNTFAYDSPSRAYVERA